MMAPPCPSWKNSTPWIRTLAKPWRTMVWPPKKLFSCSVKGVVGVSPSETMRMLRVKSPTTARVSALFLFRPRRVGRVAGKV